MQQMGSLQSTIADHGYKLPKCDYMPRSQSRVPSPKSAASSSNRLRIGEEQKLAELAIQSAIAERRISLEAQQKQIEAEKKWLAEQFEETEAQFRRELDSLDRDAEIEIGAAKLKTLDQYEAYDTGNTGHSHPSSPKSVKESHWASPSMSHHDTKPQTAMLNNVQRPHITYSEPQHFSMPYALDTTYVRPKSDSEWLKAPAFVPASQQFQQQPTFTDSLSAAFESLAEAITTNRDSLPKQEPETFSGDVIEYPVWLNSFNVLVESRCHSTSDRLYYLGRYTAGEAKECIKGLLSLHTDDAYARAKALLSDRYGNKPILSNSFRKKLDAWPEMKQGDGKRLQESADFLAQCETAMTDIGQLAVLDDPVEQKKVLAKCPKAIQDKWVCFIDSHHYRHH